MYVFVYEYIGVVIQNILIVFNLFLTKICDVISHCGVATAFLRCSAEACSLSTAFFFKIKNMNIPFKYS